MVQVVHIQDFLYILWAPWTWAKLALRFISDILSPCSGLKMSMLRNTFAHKKALLSYMNMCRIPSTITMLALHEESIALEITLYLLEAVTFSTFLFLEINPSCFMLTNISLESTLFGNKRLSDLPKPHHKFFPPFFLYLW